MASSISHARGDYNSAGQPIDAQIQDRVCFTPEESCGLKLIDQIHKAKKSIQVAMYDFSSPAIAAALAEKSKYIPVQIIADHDNAMLERSRIRMLSKLGVAVRILTHPAEETGHSMHSKWIIIDNNIETGSYDFSEYNESAAMTNYENQVYISTPKIVHRYRQEFEKVWRESSAPNFSANTQKASVPSTKNSLRAKVVLRLKKIWSVLSRGTCIAN